MLRHSLVLASALTLLAFLIVGNDPLSADDPKETPRPAVTDYTAFSKMLHKMVTKDAPKVVENRSQWGQTIPVPDRLRLPNARRTYVKVGDHLELPHGAWKRMRAWADDPAKDVQIRVRDFKLVGGKAYRLSLEAQAAVHGEGEVQTWVKGINLINLLVQADATFVLSMEIDIKASLKTDVFPPQFSIVPSVAECKITLKDFAVRRVNNVVFDGETGKDLGNEVKGYLQGVITTAEPMIKTKINEAVTESIKSGKGPSVLEVLEAVK